MKLELHEFINAAAIGDQSKYKSRRDTLIDDFCNLLGFKRWHTPSMRPDCDPKWDYFKWTPRDRGYVDNVRVMSFNHMYANATIEVAKRNDSIYPNGWKVAEVIETLMQLRREYKSAYRVNPNPIYNEWQIVAKYLLNITYSVFCRFGTKEIGFGSHDIIAEARHRLTYAILKIQNSGGLVLAAFCDEIVYYGDQVEVDGVHHEKFNKLVFGQYNSYSYGNNIRVMMHPRIMLDMEGWEPGHGIGDIESQRERRVRSVAKARELMTDSLTAYLFRTKEDVEKEFVDLSGE
ncbi:hypothetical protein [Enterobacter phage vB_EcRAM-01]|nr:hypothetical protein [Enterobacter phage vB_EcRAM-01]